MSQPMSHELVECDYVTGAPDDISGTAPTTSLLRAMAAAVVVLDRSLGERRATDYPGIATIMHDFKPRCGVCHTRHAPHCDGCAHTTIRGAPGCDRK